MMLATRALPTFSSRTVVPLISVSATSLRFFPCNYSASQPNSLLRSINATRSFPRILTSPWSSPSSLIIPSRQVRTAGPLRKPVLSKVRKEEHITTMDDLGIPVLCEPPRSDPTLHAKVVEFLEAQKVDNLVSIEMKPGVCRWATHFVVVSGKSARHLKAVCKALETELRKQLPKDIDFQVDPNSEDWNIVKFEGVVVHIMSPKAREFYQLESLWNARNEGKVSDEFFGEEEEEAEEEDVIKSAPSKKKKTKKIERKPTKKVEELGMEEMNSEEKKRKKKEKKKTAKKTNQEDEGEGEGYEEQITTKRTKTTKAKAKANEPEVRMEKEVDQLQEPPKRRLLLPRRRRVITSSKGDRSDVSTSNPNENIG